MHWDAKVTWNIYDFVPPLAVVCLQCHMTTLHSIIYGACSYIMESIEWVYTAAWVSIASPHSYIVPMSKNCGILKGSLYSSSSSVLNASHYHTCFIKFMCGSTLEIHCRTLLCNVEYAAAINTDTSECVKPHPY